MTERKLARIAEITSIFPIDGADRIECAEVENGWKVVVKKGEYEVGDLAIYIEVDSWVPTNLAPFLTQPGHSPREYNGIKGERLRTVKLRGQISQGLLLPVLHNPNGLYWMVNKNGTMDSVQLGDDVTEALGIQKWEAPIPAQLSGQVKGNFPSFIPKTDQERCQNLHKEIFIDHPDEIYEVTVKLDGTSCTMYVRDEHIGVCGRNWELEETDSNTLWRCARDQGILEALRAIRSSQGRNLALQGEVIGEGIQKNQEKIQGQKFYIYDIYDISAGEYLNAFARASMIYQMQQLCPQAELLKVPMLEIGRVLQERSIRTVAELLKYAEGPSLNPSAQREGVVFKSVEPTPFTFKAISNAWLLRNDG